MIPDFYTPSPAWPEQIERAAEMLGRISAIEELVGRAPELRRANRINSVHSSTAIEGNELSRAQVEGLANGEPVFAPPRAVKEVENALAASETLQQRSHRQRDARQTAAEENFMNNPDVQRLIQQHGAKVVPDSIRPLDE